MAPADEATSAVDRSDLTAALRRLPLDQRTAVVVRYVLGYSTAETAIVMARSEAAVRALLHRGVVALRSDLQKEKRTSTSPPTAVTPGHDNANSETKANSRRGI